jgi:hypothetical protein
MEYNMILSTEIIIIIAFVHEILIKVRTLARRRV